jgi:hypothetical protein
MPPLGALVDSRTYRLVFFCPVRTSGARAKSPPPPPEALTPRWHAHTSQAAHGWSSLRTKGVVERAGATIITHDVNNLYAIAAACAAKFPGRNEAPHIAAGTFVRFDVAALAAAETLGKPVHWVFQNTTRAADMMASHPLSASIVLYTDADVIFEPGASLSQSLATGELEVPAVFAASSQVNVSDYDAFNSGVLLINVPGFLRLYDELWAHIMGTNFNCMGGPPWDQGCLREFAAKKGLMAAPAARLRPQWHWRPYLHWPHDAVPSGTPVRLIHFHGPKPLHLTRFVLDLNVIKGKPLVHRYFPTVYNDLFNLNQEGWLWALSRFIMNAQAPKEDEVDLENEYGPS